MLRRIGPNRATDEAMAKATKKSTPPDQQMSLADIYAHVHKRNSLVPPQTTTTAILTEWREGRLPLIASEVVEKRPVCPVKPGVWVGRPAPGDKKAEAYIAELSKTRIVGHLPATAPAPLPPVEERSFNRPLPRDIPRTDIKFDWTNGGVLW